MTESSTIKSFIFIIFAVYLATQMPGAQAGVFGYKFPWEKTTKSKDARHFVKAKGKDLQMQPGDTVASYIKPNKYFITRPLRWHYALSSDELVYFIPTSLKKFFSSTKARLMNIKTGTYKGYRLQNRKKKAGHVGDVGVLVGYLMSQYGGTLPFHAFRCNGKHYVEYLSMGKAPGSYVKGHYWKVKRNCPVFNPIHRDMFETIYKDKKFTMIDKRNPVHSYHLSTDEWPKFIKDLKAERDRITASRTSG